MYSNLLILLVFDKIVLGYIAIVLYILVPSAYMDIPLSLSFCISFKQMFMQSSVKHISIRFNGAISLFPFAPDYIIGILLLIDIYFLGIARLRQQQSWSATLQQNLQKGIR
jgi:hypothetical protein